MVRGRSPSPRRERRRSRSRDRERRHRHRRSRSRSPLRKRSRSRSPRRRSPSSRHRSRSHSNERPSKSSSKQQFKEHRPKVNEAELKDMDPEEADMMRMMGFAGFDTTKGRHVEGNDDTTTYNCNIITKRKFRQYMNRRGGFNRPLDFIA